MVVLIGEENLVCPGKRHRANLCTVLTVSITLEIN